MKLAVGLAFLAAGVMLLAAGMVDLGLMCCVVGAVTILIVGLGKGW